MPTVLTPGPTADETLTLDPVSEDAANTPLELNDYDGAITVIEHAYPAPAQTVVWSQSIDTEGAKVAAQKPENRSVALRLEIHGPNLDSALAALDQKVAKLRREGGTLKRVTPSGVTMIFDVLAAEEHDIEFALPYYVGQQTFATLNLTCAPFWRGDPEQLTLHSETSLPVLVFTENEIGGSVEATGYLDVIEAGGTDQSWFVWGVQSRHYDTAETAELFYEAEHLTPLGTAAVAANVSASGGDAVSEDHSLSTSYAAMLSTELAGIGHLTHVGRYRVFARLFAASDNEGSVSVLLEWAVGDYSNPSRNEASTPLPGGQWTVIDLGVVSLAEAAVGTHQWEGRLLANSTVTGDGVAVDCLWLVPVDEASGEASSVDRSDTPSTWLARDPFDQTAGALNGKTASVGGAWATAGETTDFTVDATSHYITRSVDTDGVLLGQGRFAVIGTVVAASAVQVDMPDHTPITGTARGIVLRYADPDNWFGALMHQNSQELQIIRMIAGSLDVVAALSVPPLFVAASPGLKLTTDTAGHWAAYYRGGIGGAWIDALSGQDVNLTAGGDLATGRVGIFDQSTSATGDRNYDNFVAWEPPVDAAIFGLQSARIGSSYALREDAAGTSYGRISRYQGDYLRIPASGFEERPARVIVKASRSRPNEGPDSAIDDLSSRLTIVRRGLVVSDV